MRLAPALAVLLVGCAVDATEVVVPDAEADRIGDALVVADPEPMVELVDATALALAVEPGCPRVDVVSPDLGPEGVYVDDTAGASSPLLDLDDTRTDEPGARELWTGGCTTSDGARVEGTLERRTLGDATWIAADGFTIRRGDDVEVYLDGAVEVFAEGDLLLVEAAASLCGTEGLSCDDGPVSVDLAWSIYPATSYPLAYDATVSGVVGDAGDAATTVQGAWTIDGAACAREPTEGSFALRTTDRHILEVDGSDACDACASWWLRGAAVTPLCGLGL